MIFMYWYRKFYVWLGSLYIHMVGGSRAIMETRPHTIVGVANIPGC